MRNLALCLTALAFFSLLGAPAGRGSEKSWPHKESPTVHAIRQLVPKLSHQRILDLSSAVRAAAAEYSIPWQILVSVAFNESTLGMHPVNAKTHDYCAMQLNQKSILHYGLSRDKLLTDAAYCIRAGARMLSENRHSFSGKVPYWIGIYRSGTRLDRESIRLNAKSYDKMIRLTAAKIGYRE